MKRWLVHIYQVLFFKKGRESVGPNYDVTDKFNYTRAPTHVVGTEIRKDKNTEPKYDHYHRQDMEFDPIEAEKFRRFRS